MQESVRIEMFVDVSCPWCLGGLGTMRAVLDELAADPAAPHLALEWRFLRLHGDLPIPGPSYEEYVADWDQTPDQARQEVLDHAASTGVVVDFWKATRVHDPLLTHRMLAMVRDDTDRAGLPGMWQLMHATSCANFTHGVDITDSEELRSGLRTCGVQLPERIWERLDDPQEHLARTREDLSRAREVELDGVPRLYVAGTIVPGWLELAEVRSRARGALGLPAAEVSPA